MIKKLKNLLLDPRHQPVISSETPEGGRRSQRQKNPHRSERRRSRDKPQTGEVERTENYKVAWLALFPLALVAIFIVLGSNQPTKIAINPESLCPIENEHIARKTYILIDLSEVLAQEQRAWLHDLLKTAAENMTTRELLSISQMQTVQSDPRKEVQRFCSPDIRRIGQAGDRITNEDCPAILDPNENFIWPRNLGDNTRKNITNACKNYLLLREKVSNASNRYKNVNVEQPYSYIVGSIEDTMEDANDDPSIVPTRLIIFSDMLQNAGWFSQYRKKNHGEWTIENLLERRRNATNMGPQPGNNFNEVLLCYLPNNHPIIVTTHAQKQHRQMWKSYFKKTANFKHTEASGCAIATKELMREK